MRCSEQERTGRRVIRDDDDEAFQDRYVALFVRAQRVADRILRNDAEAEDVAAETMVRAMSSWRRVRAYSTPWVTRVAANLAIDVLRRRRSAPGSLAADGASVDTADRVALLAALKKLPGRQREAVVLRHVVGLSVTETAQAMGLSPGTVKTHLHRGLLALRLDLTQESTDAA